MASTEVKEALKKAADQIATYVTDAANMTVETSTVEIGGKDAAQLAAKTTIKLDGDSSSVLPMKKGVDGVLAVDTIIYDLHQQNVKAASDYRAAILSSLLGILRGQ